MNIVFSISHCLGVAMGSLETYTHIIPMPGLHLFDCLFFIFSPSLLFLSFFIHCSMIIP